MDNGASSYRRFLNGDDDGFVEIIKDYKDSLMLYLNTYVRNIHIAEDLTEDAFFRIAVKKPRFSEKSTFKTFLFAIGRNVAVDYLRKNAKDVQLCTDDLFNIQADEEDLLKNHIRDEQKILVHNALKKINVEYSNVLYLVYFEELKIKEAAAVINKSYKQTENLLYRAKKSLKTQLETEGFIYEEL